MYLALHPFRRVAAGGFTLLELLLVLALLVAVAAMAAPTMRGPLETYRLRRSADLVRTQWAQARNAAMKTGNIQVFQYELNGGLYFVQPWSTGADEVESSGATQNPTASASSSPGANRGGGLQLPERIVFVSGQTADDARLATLEAEAGTTTTLSASRGRPIVFYPDGTTSTARVVLTNEQGQFIVVDLRGLTGISWVSDVLAEDELPQ